MIKPGKGPYRVAVQCNRGFLRCRIACFIEQVRLLLLARTARSRIAAVHPLPGVEQTRAPITTMRAHDPNVWSGRALQEG
jgi:hypothetical protein